MKIIAEFDTNTKKAVVRMGGQEIKNITNLEMFIFDLEEGEGFITIHTVDNSKSEEGVRMVTRIEASEHGETTTKPKAKSKTSKSKDKSKDKKSDDKHDSKKLSEALFPNKNG